jgi:YVTN family beta-propeller protein
MQVTRERRKVSRNPLSSLDRSGRPIKVAVAGTTGIVLAGTGAAFASTVPFGHNQVGTTYANGIQVSSDQIIKPVGTRLVTPYGKFMGSSVSADGRFLAATSADKGVAVQIFDLNSYKLIWTAGTASTANQKLSDGTVGQESPTYSPDGKFLWISQLNGLTRFPVNADGTLGTPTSFPMPMVALKSAMPGKVAYSPDGSTLYVAVNGQNKVIAMDPTTGAVKRTWYVGIAPRELAFVGDKLYVSNEGGRRAKAGEPTINSYGTKVPANTYLGTSTNGTVSVIDTTRKLPLVKSIDVGLHPTALYVKGHAVFVANTNSDTVSVIDSTKDAVVQTIATQPWPESTVGYEPTSITLTQDGHLLVTLGRANAVAVYKYVGQPQEPVSYLGLLPTDYYPSDITTVGNQIVVTNTRGIDARGPALTTDKGQGTTPATGHGTHSTTASLTKFALPTDQAIAQYTATVFAQNGWKPGDVTTTTGGAITPVAVPTRVGDPSTIKHVFLLVKENRTYDQVYGDIAKGDGDPSLAQFGAKVTPNQHALANQFGLYDNLYDIGTNSAEGHNWLMQGDNPEYTESSAGEYVRSYDTEDDVLGHQRSGFLWTAAESAGRTVRNFGEFNQFETKPLTATWQNYYCAAKNVDAGGNPSQLTSRALKSDTESPIPSLNAITNHDFPKFDTDIPDQYRYEIWKRDFETNGPAALNMFWLSSDHTGGAPDPEAQVADGDLAVGKMVEEISHSPYWKDSAIFVVEDDSQDGVDHVDGHRAPIQVISPYAQHGTVDSTYYSQISMVRTIEQILGAQPLNQKVAAATPMYSAFTSKPNNTPFNAVPNQVPLTEGVATAPSCGTDTLGQTGAAAAKVNAAAAAKVAVPTAEKGVAAQWAAWSKNQHFTGSSAVPDYANPEQMNRYTWYQAHNWTKAYPGDAKIYSPSQVPGAYIPSSDTNG